MMNAKTNALELTVSELSFILKKAIEEQFGCVRVRGELGRVSRPASGHVYLDIKDDRTVLNAVIWRGTASRLKCQPEEGLEVIASGKLTTFPGSSRYQIVIDNIEPAGVGALMALLEERKKRLGKEGLFDESKKKALPFMPKVIGVVTSSTGSVIRDILHRLKDRFPLHVLIWPVRVQGEGCAEEVSRAIAGFNSFKTGGSLSRPDVIIVARGGGSVEDLWGFNDEAVVRVAAQSKIPLISAVGHETDWTLIDLASDSRAPTPTAAAEMAVPVQAELDVQTSALANRLLYGIRRILDNSRKVSGAAERGMASPQAMLDVPRQRLDVFTARLGQGLAMTISLKHAMYEKSSGRFDWRGLSHVIKSSLDKINAIVHRSNRAIQQISQQRGSRLEQANRLLDSLSYRNVLERGFAVILDKTGKAVVKAGNLPPGSLIDVRMQDGDISAQILGESGVSPQPEKKSVRKRLPSREQSDLF